MGFLTPSEPPLPAQELLALPLRERLRILTGNWVTDGFGTPKVLPIIYVLKMLGLYLGVGLSLATLTSDARLTDVGGWFHNIAVYQKLAIWLMLLEVLGFGGAWGPLCGHFKPMTGNFRYFLRPGTVRMAPWGDKVPGTGGDTRTVGDVVLFVGVLASLGLALAVRAHDVAGTPDQVVPGWAFIPILVTMPLLGLRDKVVFLSARSEQYLPIMLYSALLGGTLVDLVVACKVVIVVVWIGAGVSKIGPHFVNVIPPMISNSPAVPSNRIKRLHYRDAPDDLLPSRVAWFMAHIAGTAVEILVPVVLLLTTNATVAAAGAVTMVAFHLFIVSTFPLAVPLEWNVFFGFAAITLWVGHDPADFSLHDLSRPWLLPLLLLVGLFFPVLGNLRPDLVSFLPSMRQYAGNWAAGIWAMAPGVEQRLNELPNVMIQIDQLQAMPMPYDADTSELMVQKGMAWRSLHSQGRGLFSVLYEHLDDIESRTLRDGEFVCNTILGWNFGDGHLHDERLVRAVQRRLDLAPGELIVVWVESMPIHGKRQQYQVIDAALGVLERGSWLVEDCVAEQPWLPNGPVALEVTHTAEGYIRRRQSEVRST